jgi:hypothetical protein
MIAGHRRATLLDAEQRADFLAEEARDAARLRDLERDECARACLAAFKARNFELAAMHGAALADLTLEGER